MSGALRAFTIGSTAFLTVVAVITLVFGLWWVFGELQDALNTIWSSQLVSLAASCSCSMRMSAIICACCCPSWRRSRPV